MLTTSACILIVSVILLVVISSPSWVSLIIKKYKDYAYVIPEHVYEVLNPVDLSQVSEPIISIVSAIKSNTKRFKFKNVRTARNHYPHPNMLVIDRDSSEEFLISVVKPSKNSPYLDARGNPKLTKTYLGRVDSDLLSNTHEGVYLYQELYEFIDKLYTDKYHRVGVIKGKRVARAKQKERDRLTNIYKR